MLLRIKHVIVTLIEIVPEVTVTRIMPCQDKYQVVLLQFGILVRICHNILDHFLYIRLRITRIFNLGRLLNVIFDH